MIFTDIKKFREEIKKNTRVMGVDFGSKNVGLSVSDRDLNIASPLGIILRKTNKYTIQNLGNVILKNNVSAIVFGLPLNSDGEETIFCKTVRNFVSEMEKTINTPIYFYDESLTSNAAESVLFDDLKQGFRNVKKNVDKVAAVILLQDFLNFLKRL
jgi:putative Holliday junction resolvase